MTNLVLETLLLNDSANPESWIDVIIGDSKVRKKVKDLNEGDSVGVYNEGIEKSLGEIDSALEELSLRYRLAKYSLHTKNNQDVLIKNFRILLLKGLADPTTEFLEQKIMLESGFDFSREEYSSFESRILSVVHNVKEGAVRKWLSGETLSPKDWKNFERLSSINPEFKLIYDSLNEEFGYFSNWQVYVGLRTTIRSYLAKRHEKSREIKKENQESSDSEFKESGKYKAEIELILKRYINEIDHNVSSASITKIRAPENVRDYEHSDTGINLKRGLFLGQTDRPCLDMTKVREINYILSHALYDGLNRYVLRKIESDQIPKDLEILFSAFQMHLFKKTIKISSFESSFFEQIIESAEINEKQRFVLDKSLDILHSAFIEDLKNGRIEMMFDLKPNTFLNLIDIINVYRSAMPRSYYDLQILNTAKKIKELEIIYNQEMQSNRKIIRPLISELKKMDDKIKSKKDYLRTNYSLSETQKFFVLTYYTAKRGPIDIRHRFGPEIEDLRSAKQLYESLGVEFLSREFTHSVLTILGVPDAIKLYDEKQFG